MLEDRLELSEHLVADDGQPLPTGVPGVYLFPGSFEDVILALRGSIAALATGEPFQRLAIPPVISRRVIEQAGYVKTFPQLLGTVHSYTGDGRQWAPLAPLVEQGGPWHAEQRISDLVLLPAACYPVYAMLSGATLAEPAKFAVAANCFRQEATSETGRLRSFRMAELVNVATAEQCVQWRGRWLERVRNWLTALGLQVGVEVADDPFFGPGRKLYQAAQRMQELKFELKVAVSAGSTQAVASANYHKDHFGETFGFTVEGEVGHTACMAFGMERIALALINAHGPRMEHWPVEVRSALVVEGAEYD
ncbi:MAG TPA: aminoacyl--tRNA ligase-related protein [Jatrophihabitans sp.]|jgi:seryl-tRNA synthetase|nr:aminoacyl--tRNA ligase-related protein [Jatrophihabitans sp.]